jgi:hypothetical protein
MSPGGAIACFYEYLSEDADNIVIDSTSFNFNVAFGVLSDSADTVDLRAGQVLTIK